MYTNTCVTCGLKFKNKFSHAKSCSDECRNLKRKEDLGLLKTGLPTQSVGKYHELKVVMDLVEKGFDPYPAMFPQAIFDIVAVHRETFKVIRVEVKTAYRSKNSGAIVGGHFSHDNYDIGAMVIRDSGEILYQDNKGNPVDHLAMR